MARELAQRLTEKYGGGMSRFILVALLIANLLACPMRCQSCQAGVAPLEDRQDSACGCCHESQPVEAPQSDSDLPNDECSCTSCICEGATIQDDLKILGDPELSVADWIVDGDVFASKVSAPSIFAPPCLPPFFGSSRNALVAYQVWLI